MNEQKSTSGQDMLAFVYRIQKIIRDMKYLQLQSEVDDGKKAAAMNALQEVCEQLQRDFG